MRYVALLRGVNVGGNHRVPSSEFRGVLEDHGFHDVTVYLNSGNAVFSSAGGVNTPEVQAALEQHFGFAIPTLLLPGEHIIQISDAIPSNWSNDSPKPDKAGQKSDVLYLFDEINTPDVLDLIGYQPEIENMLYVPGAVLANVSRQNQSRGSLQKLIGTRLYQQMTVRNVNTARKLAELVGNGSDQHTI